MLTLYKLLKCCSNPNNKLVGLRVKTNKTMINSSKIRMHPNESCLMLGVATLNLTSQMKIPIVVSKVLLKCIQTCRCTSHMTLWIQIQPSLRLSLSRSSLTTNNPILHNSSCSKCSLISRIKLVVHRLQAIRTLLVYSLGRARGNSKCILIQIWIQIWIQTWIKTWLLISLTWSCKHLRETNQGFRSSLSQQDQTKK